MWKKILPVVLLMFVFFSCSRTPPEIQAQIDKLIVKEDAVKAEIKALEVTRDTLTPKVDSLKALREEVRVLEYAKNGGEVEYVLELKLSQDRSNMMEVNIKDVFNAVEFEINVDRRTYNHYKKGAEFLRKGRKGSAMVEGSHSDWLITVIGKHTNTL